MHWESRLHILQILTRLKVPDSVAGDVHGFLTTCIRDEAKFVRAWAYSGFQTLASQHPSYQAKAEAVLTKAQSVETAASILVRLRKARAAL